jgi:hypothetical protein
MTPTRSGASSSSSASSETWAAVRYLFTPLVWNGRDPCAEPPSGRGSAIRARRSCWQRLSPSLILVGGLVE